jgi:hypothetical protein
MNIVERNEKYPCLESGCFTAATLRQLVFGTTDESTAAAPGTCEGFSNHQSNILHFLDIRQIGFPISHHTVNFFTRCQTPWGRLKERPRQYCRGRFVTSNQHGHEIIPSCLLSLSAHIHQKPQAWLILHFGVIALFELGNVFDRSCILGLRSMSLSKTSFKILRSPLTHRGTTDWPRNIPIRAGAMDESWLNKAEYTA